MFICVYQRTSSSNCSRGCNGLSQDVFFLRGMGIHGHVDMESSKPRSLFQSPSRRSPRPRVEHGWAMRGVGLLSARRKRWFQVRTPLAGVLLPQLGGWQFKQLSHPKVSGSTLQFQVILCHSHIHQIIVIHETCVE